MKNEETTFDKDQLEHLKEGLKRSYKERFLMVTRLYKVQLTMKKAIITHKPFIDKYCLNFQFTFRCRTSKYSNQNRR
jgi:hypothetical protein